MPNFSLVPAAPRGGSERRRPAATAFPASSTYPPIAVPNDLRPAPPANTAGPKTPQDKKNPRSLSYDPGCPLFILQDQPAFPRPREKRLLYLGRSSDFRFNLLAAPSQSQRVDQWHASCVRPRLQRRARPRFPRSSLFSSLTSTQIVHMLQNGPTQVKEKNVTLIP